MFNKITSRTLIVFAIAICIIYLVISIAYKPIVLSDARDGFLSLHNYLNGGGWNKVLNINNKGSLENNELTWWAPGQYEIPYLFSKLLGNNIAISISLILFFSLAGGAFIYYKLFELYSTLSKRIVLLSLLILLLQRFININFIEYASSDLFLFFFVPLYILVYLKISKNKEGFSFYNFLVLIMVNIGGLFIKNSFLLFSLAFNIFLIVKMLPEVKEEGQTIRKKIRRSLILLPFIISIIADYYFFLKLGANPSNGAGLIITFSSIIRGIFQSIAGLLFSSLSITAIYGNFYRKVSLAAPLLNLIMLLFSISVMSIIYINRKSIKSLFQKDLLFSLTAVLCMMYSIYWLAFNVKQSAISNEDRLFLPVTIWVLPYLIDYATLKNAIVKNFSIVIISLSILYGVGTMVFRIKNYSRDDMSILSTDPKIHGFKVLSPYKSEVNKLSEISHLISGNYSDHYLISTDINVFFLLRTNNQYIYEPLKAPTLKFDGGKRYLLIINAKNNLTSLAGWKNIYRSDTYNLYLF